MPILNGNLRALLREAPVISAERRGHLLQWLKVAYKHEYSRDKVVVQRHMLNELIASESVNQDLVHRRTSLRDAIPAMKEGGDMAGVRRNQQEADAVDRAIEAERYYRSAIRLVGDHMAQRLVGDPDIIKGFGLAQGPGYVSGKAGLAAELQAFEHFYREGYMVVLNDLTGCLRAGDVTRRKGNDLLFYEAKSTPEAYDAPETLAQILRPMAVQSYVKHDATPAVIDERETTAVRLDGPPETPHFRVAGALLKDLGRHECRLVWRGAKAYVAARREADDRLRACLEELTADGDWVVCNLRTRVTQYHDLPPFTQWIQAQHSIDIVTGDVVAMTAYRFQTMQELGEQAGLRISCVKSGDDAFSLRYDYVAGSDLELVEGHEFALWHRLRISYGTLSVEDFVARAVWTFSPEAMLQMQAKQLNAEPRLARQRRIMPRMMMLPRGK